MNKRELGRSGLFVGDIGLGCMGFVHAAGKVTPKADAVRVIRTALDQGVTLLDTAECYVGDDGHGGLIYSEEYVGEAIRNITRDQVVIATKCGVRWADGATGPMLHDARPETIRRSLEGSLKRLGTDWIDLYYLHRVDPEVPVETVAETMKALIAEGKIRHWGLSMVDEDTLRRSHAVCPVTAIQQVYNIAQRKDDAIFPACEELGVGYVAVMALVKGLLSGAYTKNDTFDSQTDFRSHIKAFTEEGMEANRRYMETIRAFADAHSCTPAQFCLARLLHRKPWIVPIPGTTKVSRVEENCGGAHVALTDAEMNAFDEAVSGLTFAL